MDGLPPSRAWRNRNSHRSSELDRSAQQWAGFSAATWPWVFAASIEGGMSCYEESHRRSARHLAS